MKVGDTYRPRDPGHPSFPRRQSGNLPTHPRLYHPEYPLRKRSVYASGNVLTPGPEGRSLNFRWSQQVKSELLYLDGTDVQRPTQFSVLLEFGNCRSDSRPDQSPDPRPSNRDNGILLWHPNPNVFKVFGERWKHLVYCV